MLKFISFESLVAAIFCVACQPNHPKPVIESQAINQFVGGWINSNNVSEDETVYAFLPDGTFELETDGISKPGKWNADNTELIIQPDKPGDFIKRSFVYELDENKLIIDDSKKIITLIRRPYGVHYSLVLNRFERLTRQINLQLINTREDIREIKNDQHSGNMQLLGFWEENDFPRKLAVTEPEVDSSFAGFSEYYFIKGFLICKRGAKENLWFERNNLVLWTDPDGKPLQVTGAELLIKTRRELMDLAKYLIYFEIIESDGVFMKTEQSEVSEPGS